MGKLLGPKYEVIFFKFLFLLLFVDGMGDIMYKLSSMKFEDPIDGEEVIRERYIQFGKEMEERFRALLD